MNAPKYTDIIRSNKAARETIKSDSFEIGILSNLTLSSFSEILAYPMLKEGLNVSIEIGNYDNLIQDSVRMRDKRSVVVVWELSNIVDQLPSVIDLMLPEEVDELIAKIQQDLELLFHSLKDVPLIFFMRFSSLPFTSGLYESNKLDAIAYKLNAFLDRLVQKNVIYFQPEKVYAEVGMNRCVDLRLYRSSKALYSLYFLKEFASFVGQYVLSLQGKTKKVLVLDCDNTLWAGVLGEDGSEGIEMSPDSLKGSIFREIQNEVLKLWRKGVIVCLASKNNEEDIREVFGTHPDLLLRDEHITLNYSNWDSKPENIYAMAKKLNLGLDSFVFVDDSSFETNMVIEALPEVRVHQVPENLEEYPNSFKKWSFGFLKLENSDSDQSKTLQYKEQFLREDAKREFKDIDDYLRSLNIIVDVVFDDQINLERAAQMTQKTNQFNLTTRRYAYKELELFSADPAYSIITLSVKDKYGESGITGLAILVLDDGNYYLDTLLMSCRIIGRNIERVFMDQIIQYLRRKKGSNILLGEFIATKKNGLVEEYLPQCGFILTGRSDNKIGYEIRLDNCALSGIDYIAVS